MLDPCMVVCVCRSFQGFLFKATSLSKQDVAFYLSISHVFSLWFISKPIRSVIIFSTSQGVLHALEENNNFCQED